MLTTRAARRGEAEGCLLIFFILLVLGISFAVVCVDSEKNARVTNAKKADRGTIGGVVKEVTFSPPAAAAETTTITFDDGRAKKFAGLPDRPVKVGDNIVVTFDGNNRIITVETK